MWLPIGIKPTVEDARKTHIEILLFPSGMRPIRVIGYPMYIPQTVRFALEKQTDEI